MGTCSVCRGDREIIRFIGRLGMPFTQICPVCRGMGKTRSPRFSLPDSNPEAGAPEGSRTKLMSSLPRVTTRITDAVRSSPRGLAVAGLATGAAAIIVVMSVF